MRAILLSLLLVTGHVSAAQSYTVKEMLLEADALAVAGESVDRYVWYMSGVMAATNGGVWCPGPDYDANATIAKVYKSMSDSHAIYDYPAIHAILVGLEGIFPCE